MCVQLVVVCVQLVGVCVQLIVVCIQLVVVCVRFSTGVHVPMSQLYCVVVVVLTVSKCLRFLVRKVN